MQVKIAKFLARDENRHLYRPNNIPDHWPCKLKINDSPNWLAANPIPIKISSENKFFITISETFYRELGSPTMTVSKNSLVPMRFTLVDLELLKLMTITGVEACIAGSSDIEIGYPILKMIRDYLSSPLPHKVLREMINSLPQDWDKQQ